MSRLSQIRLLLSFEGRELSVRMREIAQDPHHDRSHENHAAHFSQVLATLLPRVAHHTLRHRAPIRRDLHHEMALFVSANEVTQQPSREQGHENAAAVERKEHPRGLMREEGQREHRVDRESRGARHERQGDHREQSALSVLNGACGHDGRHVAAETREHREKRLAVQSHAPQQGVEEQRGACQIARVFENGNEEIEDQNLREKDNHGAHTAHHSRRQEVDIPAIFGQNVRERLGQPRHSGLHPVHRILSDGECGPENQQDHEEKDAIGQRILHQEAVDPRGEAHRFTLSQSVNVRQIVVHQCVRVGRRVRVVGRRCGLFLATVVGLDHRFGQGFEPLAAAGHTRHEAHAHVRRESVHIERRSALRKLVPQVERPHHRQSKSAHLQGEQQVALQVVHIEHVDHRVDFALQELAHHISLLRRVGAQRVGARQIDKSHGAPVDVCFAHHTGHRHPRIVTRAFVSAGERVEHRGLSAVGIAHKCHRDGALSLGRKRFARSASGAAATTFGRAAGGRHDGARG